MPGHAREVTTKRLFILFGVIGAAVVATLLLSASAFSLPEVDDYAWYVTWAGLIGGSVYVLTQRRKAMGLFGVRATVYGSIATVVLLGGLFYVIARRPVTLAPETLAALDALTSPLELVVFERPFDRARLRPILDELRGSSPRVSVSFVDPDTQPALAKADNITTYGTLVLRYEGRSAKTLSTNEADIRDAIQAIQDPRPKRVHFSQGHGEKSLEAQDARGLTQIAERLREDGYQVGAVSLATTRVNPDPRAVLVIPGPTSDFLLEEVRALEAYVSAGGRLLLMIDPRTEASHPSLTRLIAFAADWGFKMDDDLVVDTSGLVAGPFAVVVKDYPAPPTSGLQGLTVYFAARSITPDRGNRAETRPVTILATGAQAWAERDMKDLFERGEPSASDREKRGAVSIGAALSLDEASRTRIIVIGDSDFVSNGFLGTTDAAALLTRLVKWLGDEGTRAPSRGVEAAAAGRTVVDGARAGYYRAAVGVALGLFGFFLAFRREPAPAVSRSARPPE